MTTVSFAIHKGGAGKTTTSGALAAWLASPRRGPGLQQRRILFVDLDPQANATECFVDPMTIVNSVGDVLVGNCPNIADAVLQPLPNLDLVPASPQMLVEEYFNRYTGLFPKTLRKKLQPLRENYDYIF